MVYKIDPGQLKLAEKLVILNDRAAGMLTRIYNIKKACADPKSKPAFLNDKHMDGALKHIVKKFPVVDTRSNGSTFNYANTMKDDIIRSLSLYYYTFADLMDLKDHIMQLLTTMDACQCQLDITLFYELTSGYLNLVVNLVSLMIMLSKVDDRKCVLGLFNAAYELKHGQCEASFPRLGQMILDYDNPLKRLNEDLGPLNRLMFAALKSLVTIYQRRNITAENWRKAQILSLSVNPQQILYAVQTDTCACEYLSLDVMDRWIVYCGTVCHGTLLSDQALLSMWLSALQMGLCLRIFRDEVFVMHAELQQFLESIKGQSKRLQEVKDCYSVALQQSAAIHADRRRFLRNTLREMVQLLKDQPGLLGPKALFVWMGLAFSRDEVLWLVRHTAEWPSSGKKVQKGSEELVDRQLPELIHYIMELRHLVSRYNGIIERYYLQYVSSYDSLVTAEVVGSVGAVSDDDRVLLDDFVMSISNINCDTDFRALRLDWFRLQSRLSLANHPLRGNMKQLQGLAVVMNANVFHLKMVDLQDELLRETSDLSIYCFYQKEMERQWRTCVQLPAQARYTTALARVCAHFPSALHDMCPEEKAHIIERSLSTCNGVLDDVSRAIGDVLQMLCEYETKLSEQTSPTQVAIQIQQQLNGKSGSKASKVPPKEFIAAGEESHRVNRQKLTMPDKMLTTIVELCAGVVAARQITVSEHSFNPREYVAQQLESRFMELIVSSVYDPAHGTSTPRRPSELLRMIQSYMAVLQNIDTCMTVDITRLFNSALLQQSQPLDSKNRETITSIYSKWYLEVVLRRAAMGQGGVIWSEHLRAMISGGDAYLPTPEQYTDPLELTCLSEIIGPYGVKYLSERLVWHVSSQLTELFKLVVANKEALHVARTQFDSADRMKDVLNALSAEHKDKKGQGSSTSAADSVLQRTAIIGQIFAFRDALNAAHKQVLVKRLPFLSHSFRNMYDSMDDIGKTELAELASALGEQPVVDAALVRIVRDQSSHANPEEHYVMCCLLLVAIAVCLPRLALNPLTTYKPSIRACLNNVHCIPVALNTLTNALFDLHGKGDTQLRMKEFLALASSGILRMADTMEHSNKEDVRGNQTALYVMLEQVVRGSRWLTLDVLEACFPYNLVRAAFQHCYLTENDAS